MCNRYAADIRKAGKEWDFYGYEEWSETRINTVLEVFPKSIGPIVRIVDGASHWSAMRWGLPGPPSTGGAPVTNIRNTTSPHWRSLLSPAHRCLVPFTAFSEYEDSSPKGAKVLRWFAAPDRGLLCFAGLWRKWSGDYGSKKEPNVGEHVLFGFLTTEPNDIVRPVHAKAMPLILRTAEQRDEWLSAPASSVAAIQGRALPDEALEIIGEQEAEIYAGAYLK